LPLVRGQMGPHGPHMGLVEQFLELKPESQAKVASHMGADADVEEILQTVEDVSGCCL
jgi:hypothetical protein